MRQIAEDNRQIIAANECCREVFPYVAKVSKFRSLTDAAIFNVKEHPELADKFPNHYELLKKLNQLSQQLLKDIVELEMLCSVIARNPSSKPVNFANELLKIETAYIHH